MWQGGLTCSGLQDALQVMHENNALIGARALRTRGHLARREAHVFQIVAMKLRYYLFCLCFILSRSGSGCLRDQLQYHPPRVQGMCRFARLFIC